MSSSNAWNRYEARSRCLAGRRRRSAKRFYGDLGWRLDADFFVGDAFHAVQFTPPGSPCSIHFGKGITSAAPGSVSGLFLVVSDIEAARAELIERGAKVSEIFHRGPGEAPKNGRQPEGRTYLLRNLQRSRWQWFAFTGSHPRLPGRIDVDGATFTSTADLKAALRRAEAAHGEYEKRTGERDANLADWYAEYMVHEQTGQPLPS